MRGYLDVRIECLPLFNGPHTGKGNTTIEALGSVFFQFRLKVLQIFAGVLQRKKFVSTLFSRIIPQTIYINRKVIKI